MCIRAIAYVTARAIQTRLDAVVGAQNWKPVFRQWHTVTDRDGNPLPSQLCTIQIFDDDRHEWLEKTDGAENTDYEPVKGGLDVYKRQGQYTGQHNAIKDLPFTAALQPCRFHHGLGDTLLNDTSQKEYRGGVGNAGKYERNVRVEQVQPEVELIKANHTQLTGDHHGS